MNEKEAEVTRVAYARLSAIKDNVPEGHQGQVAEQYVQEFHDALKQLGNVGFDIDQFRVPSDWVKKRWVGRTGAGENRYTDTQYVERGLLLAKIDSLLNYFQLDSGQPKAKIGFTGPRK